MYFRVAFVCLCAFLAVHAIPSQFERDEKVLNLFTLVRFNNSACNTTDNRQGICLSSSDCGDANGQASGNCGSGFGVCCLIEQGCGARITKNCSYFSEQNYNSEAVCGATIIPPAGTCQVRLDIISMTLRQPQAAVAPPAAVGTCFDTFDVTGSDDNIPTICGTNTDQHMYINTQGVDELGLVVTPQGTFARNWRVKVTFLECGSRELAPSGCLQYFTEAAGVIKSFNADANTPIHLINQDYSICYSRLPGMCTITHTQRAAPQTDIFQIDGTNAAAQPAAAACATDHVTFVGINGVSEQGGELCGGLLNQAPAGAAPAPVISQGFQTDVFFDNLEANADLATGSGGFMLGFQQNAC